MKKSNAIDLDLRVKKMIPVQNSVNAPEMKPVMVGSGRECLLEILRSEGVTHIFGNPGTTELPLLDTLAGSDEFTFVLGLQEATVVGMADGYAQSTGRAAFVNLHTTVGLGNAMGNIVNANTTNVPMVITAGQQSRRHLAYDPLLSGDLVSQARPVVKWAHEVRSLEEMPLILRRAFHEANTEPKGPVFVSLPMDVIDEQSQVVIPPRSHIFEEAAPDMTPIAELLLEAGKRVCMVGGDEVGRYDATQAAAEVAERLGCPVFGSPFFSGVPFPLQHPLWQGMLPPNFAQMRAQLKDYDRILLVGDQAFLSYTWSEEQPYPASTELIQFAVDRHKLGRAFALRAGHCGSPRMLLDSLASTLWKRQRRTESSTMVAQARERKAAATLAMQTRIEELALQSPLHPLVATHAVLRTLGPEAIIVDECLVANPYVRQLFDATHHEQYLYVRGAGLGWGMPAAVGAALAHPDRPVTCLVGDGAAMYSPQALWSAAHFELPVTFVVFNNREYNILKNYMRARDGYNAQAGRFIGMDLENPAIDYVAMARSMGVEAIKLREADELSAALFRAREKAKPMLIELTIASTEGSALVSGPASHDALVQAI